jgi:hypothetical protein
MHDASLYMATAMRYVQYVILSRAIAAYCSLLAGASK